ncbi:MAG: hypothetical protein LBE33_01700, partial [Zoogloeaceae bacterium]|nr:hypothetical protein [Zoogloeaceae bacterium]
MEFISFPSKEDCILGVKLSPSGARAGIYLEAVGRDAKLKQIADPNRAYVEAYSIASGERFVSPSCHVILPPQLAFWGGAG